MTYAQAQIRDWHVPADLSPAGLSPAGFEDIPKETVAEKTSVKPTPTNQKALLNPGLIDKLLPLVGKINNGGLDMTSILDLLDKSDQGLGALGKLLPLLAPLMQNGGLGNLFKQRKKTFENTIDCKRSDQGAFETINLDD